MHNNEWSQQSLVHIILNMVKHEQIAKDYNSDTNNVGRSGGDIKNRYVLIINKDVFG